MSKRHRQPKRPSRGRAPRAAGAPGAGAPSASEAGASSGTASGAGADDEERARARHVPPDELVKELTERLTLQRSAEIHGLMEILGRKRKLFAINLLAGLARGVGFFLGITIVGGLVIGATAMAFDFVAETFGLRDVNFTAIMRRFAEKAVEAERVWDDVRAERRADSEPELRAADGDAQAAPEPAPPLDAADTPAAHPTGGR